MNAKSFPLGSVLQFRTFVAKHFVNFSTLLIPKIFNVLTFIWEFISATVICSTLTFQVIRMTKIIQKLESRKISLQELVPVIYDEEEDRNCESECVKCSIMDFSGGTVQKLYSQLMSAVCLHFLYNLRVFLGCLCQQKNVCLHIYSVNKWFKGRKSPKFFLKTYP